MVTVYSNSVSFLHFDNYVVEIIRKVKKPPPLCRPSVSQQAAPPQYIQIMKQCWAEMPDMRPDFDSINQQFKETNKGRQVYYVFRHYTENK